MIRCEMCGLDVPAGANGRCFLGHVLHGAAAASSVAPVVPVVPVAPAETQSALSEAVAYSMVSAPAYTEFDAGAQVEAPPVMSALSGAISDVVAEAVAYVEVIAEPEQPETPISAPPVTFGTPGPLGALRPLGEASAAPAIPAPPAPSLAPLGSNLAPLGSAPPAPSVSPSVSPAASPPVVMAPGAASGSQRSALTVAPTEGTAALNPIAYQAPVASAPIPDFFLVSSGGSDKKLPFGNVFAAAGRIVRRRRRTSVSE